MPLPVAAPAAANGDRRGRGGRRAAGSGGACPHPNPARPDRQAQLPLAAGLRSGPCRSCPGEYPFTRGIRADGYASRAVDDAPVRGLRVGRGDERALPPAARARADRASRSRSTCRRSSASTRTIRSRAARWAARASRSTRSTTCCGCSTASRSASVSTSMTINAPAAVLLLLYELAGAEHGVAPGDLRGTVQNDVLKEYAARGNYIFPPRPSMRLTVDLFRYCNERLPRFNTISISGYHIREAGSSAAQELGFTLANGIAYVEAALAAGLEVDVFAPRLSFFFNAHNDVFAEVAKFRAARRIWATLMRERFGARDERSLALRFHAQTGGSTLTAQGPLNNVVRVALQAFAATAGGCQSLHTNGYDEALALPTERSATLALRTQQVLLHESGVAARARSVRRLGVRRGPDRRDRARGARADRRDRRARRRGRGDRERLGQGPHRGRGVRAAARDRERRDGDRRRQPLPRPARTPTSSCSRSRRPASRRRSSACEAVRARARRGRVRARAGRGRGGGARRRRCRCSSRCARALAARCTVGEVCRALARRVGELRRAGLGRALSALRTAASALVLLHGRPRALRVALGLHLLELGQQLAVGGEALGRDARARPRRRSRPRPRGAGSPPIRSPRPRRRSRGTPAAARPPRRRRCRSCGCRPCRSARRRRAGPCSCAPVVVWRPRSLTGLSAPVASVRPVSAFVSDVLPTPEWPASTATRSASARAQLVEALAGAQRERRPRGGRARS